MCVCVRLLGIDFKFSAILCPKASLASGSLASNDIASSRAASSFDFPAISLFFCREFFADLAEHLFVYLFIFNLLNVDKLTHIFDICR